MTVVFASITEEKIRKQIICGIKQIIDNNARGIFMMTFF